MSRLLLTCFVVLALPACGREPPPEAEIRTEADALVGPPEMPASAWRSDPAAGAEISAAGDTLLLRTQPHAVLWRESAPVLTPPYTVEATLQKRSGRLHEGYGLLFGGSGLGDPEEQRYSYFLVRGDGSFLIKRRDGAETALVHDWTAHPAVMRDSDGGAAVNRLRVEVGPGEAVFRVGDAEVARVPLSTLHSAGVAGLRVAHEVDLAVPEFIATPGAREEP